INVEFSKVVNVNTTGGTPFITVETGTTDQNANYASGSGSNTLVFEYTVQPGDNSTDLNVLSASLNGGTIKDNVGNDADLTLPPGENLADNNAIIVDGLAPEITAISGVDGNYGIGQTITISVEFSEVVDVNTTGGTPFITLETGTTDRNA